MSWCSESRPLQKRGRTHEGHEHRDAVLRRGLAQLPLRQAHHRHRHRRLERVRRGLRRPGRERRDRAAVAARRGAGGRLPRADLRRAVLRHAASRRRHRRLRPGRHRERVARRQGQGPGCAGLRTPGRQGARSHPRLLVALRHVAHQSSDPLCPGDHRHRRREGDRAGSTRERFRCAQDQHLHLRCRWSERIGLAARVRRAVRAGRQCRAVCGAQSRAAPRGATRGRRARRRYPARSELQRKDGGLS